MSEYKVILEKEYYKLSKDEPTIGLLMMVKNETKRIHVTLESVVNNKTKYVDAIIVYDTGSTDNTVEIIEKFAEKHEINVYIIQGTFVDFSTSRNVSLTYADTINVHYLLLMDCNDELRGGEGLRMLAKDMLQKETNAFLVCQQWWSGMLDSYLNIRFIKARCGWRYFGIVHEWLKDTTTQSEEPKYPVLRLPETIVLYQDRTKDDDKSSKRFFRDRELLLKEYKKNPKEPRTLFYLAQTCQCLGNNDEALYYSKLRIELEGFQEEIFHSYMRIAVSSLALGHEWHDSMKWYIKAYEHSNRAEPLVKLADFYRHYASFEMKANKPGFNNKWKIAYMFIKEACDLNYPEQSILFVDKGVYKYYRWHLMGIIGFYVGKLEEGKKACLKAIEDGHDRELNEKNLQFYIDAEKKKVESKKETKQEFLERTVKELTEKYPKLGQKNIYNRATKMWNEYKN